MMKFCIEYFPLGGIMELGVLAFCPVADLAITRSQLSVLLSSSSVDDVLCIFVIATALLTLGNPEVSLSAPVSDNHLTKE
jgi:hypothetical protein